MCCQLVNHFGCCFSLSLLLCVRRYTAVCCSNGQKTTTSIQTGTFCLCGHFSCAVTIWLLSRRGTNKPRVVPDSVPGECSAVGFSCSSDLCACIPLFWTAPVVSKCVTRKSAQSHPYHGVATTPRAPTSSETVPSLCTPVLSTHEPELDGISREGFLVYFGVGVAR